MGGGPGVVGLKKCTMPARAPFFDRSSAPTTSTQRNESVIGLPPLPAAARTFAVFENGGAGTISTEELRAGMVWSDLFFREILQKVSVK